MFCSHCGGRIPEGSRFCPSCGAPVVGGGQDYSRQESSALGVSDMEKSMALGSLVSRMRQSARLWEISGWIQVVLSVLMIVYNFYLMMSSELMELELLTYGTQLVSSILILVTGIINIGVAYRNKSFVKAVQEKPVGIIEFFEKMGTTLPIVMNILALSLLTISTLFAAFKDNTLKKEMLSPASRRIFMAIESSYNSSDNGF